MNKVLILLFLIFCCLPVYSEIKLEARVDVPVELNLEKTLNIAIENNLEIIQAEYGKNIYRWKFWENIGNFLPDYKVGFSDQRLDGSFLVGGVFPVMALTTSVNAFMRFDYPFFEGGRGFFNTLSAKKLYSSSKENLASSLNNILLEAAKAYNQLLNEEAKLDVFEKAVEEARLEVELNKNLNEEGVGTRFNVLESEAQLAEEEQGLIAQESIVREAAISLARILNLDQGTYIKADKNDLKPKELFSIERPITELIEIALKNRPEVKKAHLEYLAQRNQIRAAFSGFLPTANFYGQFGGTGNAVFHRTKVREVVPDAVLLDENGTPLVNMVSRGRLNYQISDSGIDLTGFTNVSNVVRGAGDPFLTRVDDSLMANKSIGIQVDWQVGDGLGVSTISRINQARNQAKLLKTNAEVTNQKIEQEVRTGYLEVQTAEKLMEVAKKRVTASTEALELAKVRVENGVGINTELLNAQKQYKESLASEVNATVEYNNSQAELLHSLGIISIERLLGSSN